MDHPLVHPVHRQSGAPHLHVLPEQRSCSCSGSCGPRRLMQQCAAICCWSVLPNSLLAGQLLRSSGVVYYVLSCD